MRIQRLLAEALEQGAIATQEDLARTLSVSVRTVKRDFALLHTEGCYLASRGYLHGIGRGPNPQSSIVELWLQGMTYDQIATHTHHSLTSIQRYILTFVRVVHLRQQEFEPEDIAHLVQLGLPLVAEYLTLFRTINSNAAHRRLQDQLDRLLRDQKRESR